jgi:hypothetical protein
MKKTTEKDLTRSVTHPQVVTVAVFFLGGADKFVDTEDVAVKAAQLAPGRFSWRKYRDQINLELVRVYLSDAKKTAHGALVEGSGRRGWTLTSAGLRFARKIAPSLSVGALARDPNSAQAGSVDHVRRDRERRRIEQTSAWASWIAASATTVPIANAKEVFRIDSYVTSELVHIKIERLRKIFIDDPEITKFIDQMASIVVNAR